MHSSVVYQCILYYLLIGSVDEVAVRSGIARWEEKTCIRFVKKPSTYRRPQLFFKKLTGCYSHVGYLGMLSDYSRGQDISIGPGCEDVSSYMIILYNRFYGVLLVTW